MAHSPVPGDRRPSAPARDASAASVRPEARSTGAARRPVSAAEWVERIREEEMPALGATVALVQSITDDETASTDRLARVILQDAAMTAKVLKLANSAFYNPSRLNISTISRAIIVLGFNVVAEMAVGIRLVDALLSGGVRQRVVEEMARSFHAAVLARSIATIRRDPRSEEMFIAALLSNVGEMAFWSFGGEAAQQLDEALGKGELDPEAAQVAVVGFRLRQLSVGLAREWKLGPLLQSVLEERRPGPPEVSIRYALRVAAETRKGWESPASVELVAKLADFVGIPVEQMTAQLVSCTEEAVGIAACFGAGEAALQIPAPRRKTPEPAVEVSESHEPDPMLQLRILRELSGMISTGAGLNQVMNLVLEGLYRGVGFDRVLFAMLTPNRLQLVAKAGLGSGIEALRQHFLFSLDDTPEDLFNEFFRQPRALRFRPSEKVRGLRFDRLQMVTTASQVCIAPIVIKGRVIGLFYADRLAPVAVVDDEAFEAFQLFVQQVSLTSGSIQSGERGA